mmetsp:Transcript_30608/g.91505  ORF Transcript_30608/g.91505 Transcript_30608/m.91505 type:complete len:306 (+) Transcript_30608:399-1316(+)
MRFRHGPSHSHGVFQHDGTVPLATTLLAGGRNVHCRPPRQRVRVRLREQPLAQQYAPRLGQRQFRPSEQRHQPIVAVDHGRVGPVEQIPVPRVEEQGRGGLHEGEGGSNENVVLERIDGSAGLGGRLGLFDGVGLSSHRREGGAIGAPPSAPRASPDRVVRTDLRPLRLLPALFLGLVLLLLFLLLGNALLCRADRGHLRCLRSGDRNFDRPPGTGSATAGSNVHVIVVVVILLFWKIREERREQSPCQLEAGEVPLVGALEAVQSDRRQHRPILTLGLLPPFPFLPLGLVFLFLLIGSTVRVRR